MAGSFVVSTETSVCPVCGGALTVRSHITRTVVMRDSNRQMFRLRRLQCRDCGRSHRELPDFITPYKRHCTETIERVLSVDYSGEEDDTPCENSTIRRLRSWWRELKPYFLGVLLSLETKLGIVFPAPAPFKTMLRAVVNSGHWLCTRSVCVSP